MPFLQGQHVGYTLACLVVRDNHVRALAGCTLGYPEQLRAVKKVVAGHRRQLRAFGNDADLDVVHSTKIRNVS